MNQSPFKFLDSYTKEDKDIFFGREAEVEDVYTKVFQGKILLVYGASGTGKSSLISCGLANKFQDSDWLPVEIRRGININDSLRQQLQKIMLTPVATSKNISFPKLLKSIYLDHFKPIFLVFDQFEELFIFGDREEEEKFIATIREVLDSDLQVRFIFIIRGEYLEYLTDFEQVLPEIFGNRIRIEKMTRTNAVNCITGPCRSFGIEVEEHFSDNLLTKLSPSKTEIELTYLQVFLDRIFKKASEKAKEGKIVFSNTLLEELGNVGDVLSQFLDEQIELIPDSEKALALLKAFVSTDATKKQISLRQAAEFVKTIGQELNEKQVDILIQELVNRRILKDKDEAGRYELRHDSIAAKIFEKITTYERDLLEVNQFITYAFGEHDKRNFLLNESDLAYIAPYETKLNFPGPVREFIEKSKTAVRKKKRSRKQFYAVLGVISILLLTSVFGLVYSQKQKSESDRNAALAKEQSAEALNQKEIAEQQRVIAEQKQQEADKQAKIAGEKQQEADKQARIAQEQSSLALIQKQEADKQRQLANTLRANAEEGQRSALAEKEKADAAKQEAEKFSKLAEKNSQLANQEKDKATRFRMLAIAQAMGAKAAQLQDRDQKVLVAQQAYLFNKQYNGYPFQPDIYNGLYAAYEAVNSDKFNTTSLHQGAIKGLISLGPNVFITAGADGKIIKTDLNTDPPTVTTIDSHPYVFQCIALSQDKKLIAFGAEEGKLLIYDATSLKKIKELNALQTALWTLVFDAQGYLYTASGDKNILRWNMRSYESTPLIKTDAMVNSLSINSKNGVMAAGLANGEVLLLKILDTGVTTTGKVSGVNPVTKVKFNTAGSMLAIGKEDGSIVLWDVASSEISQSLTGHRAMVSDLRFSPDDLFLLSASYDGTSMFWNMKSINERQVVFADHGGWVLQASFNPNGRNLITADALGSLRYFPLNMEFYSTNLCSKIKRNMTEKEWSNFVGSDIPYQKTCDQ
ncbi:MAG: hypothetical protein IPP42_05825 [Saprospiraceae bacterium]|nr:hypothetical protein [Saprospiraceae bacterium]